MYTKESLEQIIDHAELDKNIKTDMARQRLMDNLKNNIKIVSNSEQIFNVSYESTNPTVAQKVVQAVLAVLKKLAGAGIISDSVKTLHFLEAQIKDYAAQLKHAEETKEEFTRSMLLKGAGDKEGDSVADLQANNKRLIEAKIQLTVALSRKQALQEELDKTMADGGYEVPDVNKALSPEDEEIQNLNAQINVLRRKYTDNHPEIVRLKKEIEAIVKSKKIEPKDPLDEFNKSILINPYLQQLKISLNEEITQVAAAQAMVDELTLHKSNIENHIYDGLRAETELKNINRNYQTIKDTHDQLLKNREELVLSMKRDELGTLQFNIKDSPNVPLQPSSPNRKLLFSAVFAGAIISGFGIAFLLYFIRPMVMSTNQARLITGLPILGSVSMKSSPGLSAKIKMEYLKYGYASLALIFIYAGLMTIDILEIKTLTLSHWL
jgi:polysaccharide chain length determinant protein (PEP-CTERM system associated)